MRRTVTPAGAPAVAKSHGQRGAGHEGRGLGEELNDRDHQVVDLTAAASGRDQTDDSQVADRKDH